MAFSMHTHSGQFCPGHARNTLEEVLQRALTLNMRLLAFTEHMPRTQPQDLYPEEIESHTTIATLMTLHEAYLAEARRLQSKYAARIPILIGFEAEWIRASDSPFVLSLAAHPSIDFFIGSVHHVHMIPIDFDAAMYGAAREAAGGTDDRLFEDYFDAQWEMLTALRPRVVGHFDLVRLFSGDPDRDVGGWDGVWRRVVRNLGEVVKLGALLEVNSSALRKGLREPYPGRRVCETFLQMGGKFTLSDDSHGVDQVGLNLQRTLRYLEELGVKEMYHFEKTRTDCDSEIVSELAVVAVPIAHLKTE